MIARILTIVPAMVLALSAATALAQPAASPFAQFDRTTLFNRGALLRPYDQAGAAAGNAAYVSDGSDPSYLRELQELTNEPGYSIGTGTARVGGA